MAAASRVKLVPPEAWDEVRLLEATRDLSVADRPLRPGDEVGGLVVVQVEPEPGAEGTDTTEFEVVARPREGATPSVEIAVLLDASESMSLPWSAEHSRQDASREAVAAFLRSPGAAVAEVVVIEYAKDVKVVAGPAAPEGLALPAAPKPKGRSSTGAAINAALAALAARGGERAQSILMLTDGVGEVTETLHAAQRAGRLRIPVHVLVFAPDIDEVFDEVARASGGTVQKATLPLTIEFEHDPGAG